MLKTCLLVFLTLFIPAAPRAAEVMTDDGQKFEGKILEEQDNYVLMEIENGVQVKIERSQIVYVKREDEVNKRKRDYPLLGITFGDPAILNGVAGYFWGDLGLKMTGGYWGSLWGVQLNLSKTLVDNKPLFQSFFRDFAVNFSLVGGLAGNDGSTKGSRWSNNVAPGSWTYAGIGVDLNAGGFFMELDGVTGNFPNNVTFPFQIGYVNRFN